MKDLKSSRLFQTVILTLSNGKKGSFTGKVLVRPEDAVAVTDIQFTFPRELPRGCAFEEVPVSGECVDTSPNK